jgi:Ca2+-binding RTX toxin-like protein
LKDGPGELGVGVFVAGRFYDRTNASRGGETVRRILVIMLTLAAVMLAAPPGYATYAATVYCNGVAATIVGTSASETIHGTSGTDVIAARGGDDVVFGGPEGDEWYGDNGDDTICGGWGEDSIEGDAGRDHMFGGAGADAIVGGPGYDWLMGGPGGDYLEDDDRGGIDDTGYGAYYSGGGGPDRILAGIGETTVLGGWGEDHIRAYNYWSRDIIRAGTGDDVVNSVDLNTATFASCSEIPCTHYKDRVDGGDGIDDLTHDGDDWTSFEIRAFCPFDPDNNWDEPCGSLAI